MKELAQQNWVKWTSGVVMAIILILLLEKFLIQTIIFLLPFIIIGGMSAILKVPVDFLEKKKVPRWAGTLVSLLAFLAMVIGMMSVIIIQLINGSKFILKTLTEHSTGIVKYIEELYLGKIMPVVDSAKEGFSILGEGQKEEIRIRAVVMGENVLQGVTNVLQKFLEVIPEVVGVLPGLFAGLVFVSLATFFLTKDMPKIKTNIKSLLNIKQIKQIQQINKEMKTTVVGFVKAQFILIGMTFVVVWVGLTILGVEYAFLIALGIGIVDLLPYLGTGFILWPWMGYAFLVGDTKLGFGLIILYIVVVIQRNIVEPKILSAHIGVDPLSTLIAIYLGLVIYGPIGLALGPILLIVFKMIWNIYRTNKIENT